MQIREKKKKDLRWHLILSMLQADLHGKYRMKLEFFPKEQKIQFYVTHGSVLYLNAGK